MKDITTSEDITFLMETFYTKARVDSKIAHFFVHTNFDKHLPKIVQFWEFVLLDKSGYKTDVTKVHMGMKLNKEHFDRWIELFNATVDNNFKGEKAELAKQKAFLMRWTMESKIVK